MRNTATSEIKDYQQRFSNVANFYELLFKDLIVEKCDSGEACQSARKFFGKDIAKLVAIDGTEYSRTTLLYSKDAWRGFYRNERKEVFLRAIEALKQQ